MLKKSPVLYKEFDIDFQVISLRETLEGLNNYFILPEEIREKIQEIILIIDERYYPLPEHENDITINEETYKVCYKYQEYLE